LCSGKPFFRSVNRQTIILPGKWPIFRSNVLAAGGIRLKLTTSNHEGGHLSQETEENRIRLLLLDDQALLRASLAHFLASEPDLLVMCECGTPAEALEILSTSPIDVVLLDFGHAMEGRGGLISAAQRNGFQGRFLIVAESADTKSSAIAIKLGASGIFLKAEAPHRLVLAIKVVAGGGVWLDPRIVRLLADESAGRFPEGAEGCANRLTDREQRVLLGILGGLTNRKIGENLGLSESSVKTAVQQLFYRTGVRTRGQLVRVAIEGSLSGVNGLTKSALGRQSND
jgi:DNA-binding NarL/FixJ family response regulator